MNLTQNDLQLESITIALRFSKGNDVLELCIVEEKDDKPNQNQVIEQFTIYGDGDKSIRVINIDSKENPILYKANRYWLSLTAGRTNNRITLWGAPLDFRPRPSIKAKRSNGGNWEVGESKSGPGYAIRIVGSKIL